MGKLIRVSDLTHSYIKLGASMYGIPQGHLINCAVREYLETHKESLEDRVAKAREALAKGDDAVIKFLRGENF